MEEEQKSNENLTESSNESTGKFRMPWQNKFGEDENLKNRQYSRTARNQPVREATTLSKVLLFMVVCTCLIPFIVYMWVNATRGSQTVTPKTASQVSIARVESSSSSVASSSVASSESSATSQSGVNVTTNSVASTETAQSSSANENTQTATDNTTTTRRRRTTTQEQTQTQEQEQTQTPAQTGGQSYTIQAGDSWYSIATRHGIDVYTLAAANGATIDSLILPGQTITIP